MNVTLLISVGGIIILALAVYAGYLLWQVKKQENLKQEFQDIAVARRNANIFDNVNTLCMVGIQGQCDLSELSIRLCGILEYVQGENRIDVARYYPALSELHDIVRGMARGEERMALEKRERMEQDFERNKAEARLTDAILEELNQLQERIQPLAVTPKDTVSITQ